MTKTMESFSREDTHHLGKEYGRRALPGQVFCLDGDLGAGKTVFAQGFAEGLGISEPVSSPTFTILQVYEEGRMPLYHVDAYRISDPEEMYEVGLPDYLDGEGVCLIEWAGLIEDLLPPDAIRVTISRDLEKDFDYRRIEIEEDMA